MISGRVCLLALVLLALPACGLLQREPQRPCPTVAVLEDAAAATQFKPGPGRDLADVRFQAEFGNLQSSCRYDKSRVTVALVVDVLVLKGPAADAEAADFAFFVAVTERGDRILTKEVFQSRIAFTRDRRRAGVREELEQVMQLPAGRGSDDYELLVGFQLEADQLDYNRRLRGRR